jgi:hypothetical protein
VIKKIKYAAAVGLCWLAGCLGGCMPGSSDTFMSVAEFSSHGAVDTSARYSYLVKGNNEKSQAEVLVGKSSKRKNLKSKLYFDAKTDLEGKVWAGVRGGIGLRNGKTNFGFQLRHFSGLNDSSADHFYCIPSISRELTDNLSLGLWYYIKQDYDTGKGFAFLGPFLVYSPNSKSKALIHYGENMVGEGALLYLKMNFRF